LVCERRKKQKEVGERRRRRQKNKKRRNEKKKKNKDEIKKKKEQDKDCFLFFSCFFCFLNSRRKSLLSFLFSLRFFFLIFLKFKSENSIFCVLFTALFSYFPFL
jgi:hypothetical protein